MNNDLGARLSAGSLKRIEHLLAILHPPKRPVEVPEKPYVDPALR